MNEPTHPTEKYQDHSFHWYFWEKVSAKMHYQLLTSYHWYCTTTDSGDGGGTVLVTQGKADTSFMTCVKGPPTRGCCDVILSYLPSPHSFHPHKHYREIKVIKHVLAPQQSFFWFDVRNERNWQMLTLTHIFLTTKCHSTNPAEDHADARRHQTHYKLERETNATELTRKAAVTEHSRKHNNFKTVTRANKTSWI